MSVLLAGTVHATIPSDLKKSLLADKATSDLWQHLTPLARNEWICWVISPKKRETRDEHVARVVSELHEGIHRPCCWIGCIHRTDKELSPSVRGIISKR